MKSVEKWPARFEIVKISESLLSEVLNIFLIICVANKAQTDTASEVINFLVRIPIADDKEGQLVSASLVTENKLISIKQAFTPRSKSWRGQYQVISKFIVAACEKALAEK
jgi:hypothetical protein